MPVEAAWAVAKAPGPLHAFFVRIRARRGHQVAAAAVARKLAALCWRALTKDQDDLRARPSLVANKTRAMELQAGKPQKKGDRRGPAYAYNVKALRDREQQLAQQAERNHPRFVEPWRTRPPKGEPARAPQSGKEPTGRLAALAADAPRFAARSLAHLKNSSPTLKALVDLIRRADLVPMLPGKAHKGEDVDLGLVEEGLRAWAACCAVDRQPDAIACRRRRPSLARRRSP